MPHTTTQLQAWLVRDDDESFNNLIAALESRLRDCVQRMLGKYPIVRPQHETGDVLHQALIELPHAFRMAAVRTQTAEAKTGKDFLMFAAELIRHNLLDLAKKHRVRSTVPLPPDSVLMGPDPCAGDPVKLGEMIDLHEATAKLSGELKEVLHLIFYVGLSQNEAAEQLGITDRTVRKRLLLAKLQLSEMLGGQVRLPDGVIRAGSNGDDPEFRQ